MATTSALVDFPETGRFVTDFQESILGIVTFTAIRAGKKIADVRALAIVVIGDSEGRTTTAWDEEHLQLSGVLRSVALGTLAIH
jgi:hypothetical protein